MFLSYTILGQEGEISNFAELTQNSTEFSKFSKSHTPHSLRVSPTCSAILEKQLLKKKRKPFCLHGYISVIVTLKHFNPNECMCECENQTVVLCTLESQGL